MKIIPVRNTKRQTGTILPMLALGLLVLVGVAGFAIDTSHTFVNVTRLQNALDSAALSAGHTVNEFGGDAAARVRATTDGTDTFNAHLEGELTNSLSITFQYSNTLFPFNPGGLPARYVRATVTNHTIPVWFARVLPGIGDTTTIGTTAVSGPIPLGGGEVCDIAPLVVCGDVSQPPTATQTFGLPFGSTQCLKSSIPQNGNENGNNGNSGNNFPSQCTDPVDPIGPGNFQLLDLGCPSQGGAACVRQNLAGNVASCASIGGTVETKPGDSVGPVAQGFNTRFNDYQGGQVSPSVYPPDRVTNSTLTYDQYLARHRDENYDNTVGRIGDLRRIMRIPIADCSTSINGQGTLTVLGFGCYFLLEPTVQTGQDNWIIGELVEQCESNGNPGETPSTTGGNISTFRIILFNDPGNLAS